jgi:hypothetical protein
MSWKKDLTDSDDDEEESHFQYQETEFQMFQLQKEHEITGVPITEAMAFHQAFGERNAQVLFKQNHSKKIELDLEEVILLDSQSTMDLFCNPKLVGNTYKSDKNMRLTSNCGTMKVNHKATMKGYNSDVWFSEYAITNIIALKNLIKQY